jgi:DNA-binding transcriptional LysR family regulator
LITLRQYVTFEKRMILTSDIKDSDMTRNLDLTALRSFVAIADAGGVTRAAGFLNLTQSAVSMQIKRLEDMLQVDLLDRSARKVALTAPGEQLLGYARRMLSLNDEAFGRLTHNSFEGEIVLGVPHDIVYPNIPQVLQRFNRDYPKMRVTLLSSFTRSLLEQFGRGECDIILSTETGVGAQGETMVELPLVWIGAPGGQAWRQRPLRLAYEHRCIFRQGVQAALDAAGVPWEMAVESDNTRTIEASVSADLAVHTMLAGSEPAHLERIAHGGTLPDLAWMKVNLYVADPVHSPAVSALADLIRRAFAPRAPRADRAALVAATDDLALQD